MCLLHSDSMLIGSLAGDGKFRPEVPSGCKVPAPSYPSFRYLHLAKAELKWGGVNVFGM